MAMNRVQFQPGLSMPEFLQRYGTEEQCAAARRRPRAGRAASSARECGGAASTRFVRGGLRYWQCSGLSPPVQPGQRHHLRRHQAAADPLVPGPAAARRQSKNNVSALELKRQLGVCYRTAWLLKHKIMEAMRLREDSRELDGRVEIDDAYLGGERSGGKAGRGSENKIPIVAAVQTTPDGQPIVACLRQQPHTAEEVAVFAAQHLATSATVVSDGLWCFRATQIVGAEHERVVTGGVGKASSCPSSGRSILCSVT